MFGNYFNYIHLKPKIPKTELMMADFNLKIAIRAVENKLQKGQDSKLFSYLEAYRYERDSIHTKIINRRKKREMYLVNYLLDKHADYFLPADKILYENLTKKLSDVESTYDDEPADCHHIADNYRWQISEFVYKLAKNQDLFEPSENATCITCISRRVNAAFLPCGHAKCCMTCANTIETFCPICRKTIEKVQKLYF